VRLNKANIVLVIALVITISAPLVMMRALWTLKHRITHLEVAVYELRDRQDQVSLRAFIEGMEEGNRKANERLKELQEMAKKEKGAKGNK
jgi:hypothetical protein